jgi:hypothetical protein
VRRISELEAQRTVTVKFHDQESSAPRVPWLPKPLVWFPRPAHDGVHECVTTEELPIDLSAKQFVYMVGGNDSDGEISASVERYDIAQRCVVGRCGLACTTKRTWTCGAQGCLYALGGVDSDATFAADVFRYSPNTNTWATMAPMSRVGS